MITDVYTGDDVLEWLGTDDAAQQARRLVARRGLSAADVLADDVLQEAWIAVRLRMRRPAPLAVDNPGGYGTTVIRSVVRKLAQGRNDVASDAPTAAATTDRDLDDGDLHLLDDLRVVVERLADRHAWVTSATLSLVTLRAYPEIELDGVPAPEAGATPDQARGWPALWFAGRRDVFPDDGDTHRERARKNTARSRSIRKVTARLEKARERYLAELGIDDG